MSKKIALGTAVVLMLLSILVTFQITYISVNNKYEKKINELTGGQQLYEKLTSVDETFRKLYIGDIDEDNLIDNMIRGYVAGTGDKYATYMSRTQFKDFMSDNHGKLEGIGVYVIFNNDYNAIEIINVMPDSPALNAGVVPGDLIISVGGIDITELGYYSAVNKLKGEIGTKAEFTVIRNYSENINFSIERGYVTEVTVMARKYADTDIGIIKILQFDKGTPAQFKEALKTLKDEGVTKYVFDVRYNPGGDLDSICEVLDILLPSGPIVRIVDRAGKEEVISSDNNEIIASMAVLINEKTASAAELFSAALKDYKKATLVGLTTYGKGTMQTVIRLPDNSALSVSNKMYNPPHSDNYEGIGVTPNVEIAQPEEVMAKNIYKITDQEDAQLQKAIEILK